MVGIRSVLALQACHTGLASSIFTPAPAPEQCSTVSVPHAAKVLAKQKGLKPKRCHSFSTDGCSKVWHQCGGVDWDGPTCCEGGTRCYFVNDHYSHCRPSEDTQLCAPQGQRCGGIGHTGPTTCCIESEECTRSDDWYSGCQQVYRSNRRLDTPAQAPSMTQCAAVSPAVKASVGLKGYQLASCCPPEAERSRIWKQCGGREWTGATCCEGGTTCIEQNEWFSMCKPARQEEQCVAQGQKCGGHGHTGPTKCCIQSETCVANNDYHSGCRPSGQTDHH